MVLGATATLGVSTPMGPDNAFSKIITLKDEYGKPFFRVIWVTLACEKCQRGNAEDAIKCKHKPNVLPPWHSAIKHDRNKHLYEVLGDSGRGAREIAGMIVSDNQAVFESGLVRGLFENIPLVPTNFIPELIITCVDPNACGLGSDVAIVSGYMVTARNNPARLPLGSIVIIGIDSSNCRDDITTKILVQEHYNKICETSEFLHANKLFIPENNSNTIHSRMTKFVQDYNLTRVHYEKDKAGICKTEMMTEDYVRTCRIYMQEKKIFFHNHWFSQNETMKGGRRIHIIDLEDQALRFGYNKHGKLTGKQGNQKDDIIVTFMMLLYWTIIINNTTKVNY